jgi:molybdopterin/thiamine biosynthesis adenylyltransferase
MAKVIRAGSADEDRFDRSKRIGWLNLDAISRAKVLMVGAGALGNEVAKDIVLSGFKRITVVDMDHVVLSNLNRCLFFREVDAKSRRKKAVALAEGMKDLSPECDIEAVAGRVEELPDRIFRDHDIVFGCLDNVHARVHINSHAYCAGRVYIDGGMEGFVGRVFVARPPDGACLQCGMNRSHSKITNMRFSCTGTDVVFHEPKLGAEITTTSILSAVMVREALKHVSKRHDLMLVNAFYYDGQRNVAEEYEVSVNPDCPVHSKR